MAAAVARQAVHRFWHRIVEWERRLRRSFGRDINTPKGRLWALFHYGVFDHAFLRVFWSNFATVAPGVYRSNQPTVRRFRNYRNLGIRTIINLRGIDSQAHYLFEQEACTHLNLSLVNVKMQARRAPQRDDMLRLIDAMRTTERPFLFHCKSGADRAGIAAAIYLLVFENEPVSVAARQLSPRFIHFNFMRTGVLDYVLEVFAARQANGRIEFEEWLKAEYDARAIQQGFDNRLPAEKVAAPRKGL